MPYSVENLVPITAEDHTQSPKDFFFVDGVDFDSQPLFGIVYIVQVAPSGWQDSNVERRIKGDQRLAVTPVKLEQEQHRAALVEKTGLDHARSERVIFFAVHVRQDNL